MDRGAAVLGGVAVGAIGMYLLDPQMGRSRRALLQDQLTRSGNVAREGLATTWRGASNRPCGLAAEARGRILREPSSNSVLAEHIRPELGFVAGIPAP